MEFDEYMEFNYKDKRECAMDDMIKFLRETQRRFLKEEIGVSGYDLLKELLADGIIKLDVVLLLRKLIDDLEMPYEIKFRQA